jgi:hypothetical protein
MVIGQIDKLCSNSTEIRVMVGQGRYFFFITTSSLTTEPAQPPVGWVTGPKRTEHVNGPSSSCGAEVRNTVYLSLLWYFCMRSWHRHNFSFCVALGTIYSSIMGGFKGLKISEEIRMTDVVPAGVLAVSEGLWLQGKNSASKLCSCWCERSDLSGSHLC